ncbi:MAG: hypothetical protein V4717_23375 [Bacteroidota bacterium]
MQNLKINSSGRLLLAGCLILLLALRVQAQENNTDSLNADMDKLIAEAISDSGDTESASRKMDSAILAIMRGSESNYNRFSNMHLQRSLSWQFYSSIMIFFMVIFIVAFGLYLSFLQFKLFEKVMDASLMATEKELLSKALEDSTNMLRTDVGLSKDSLKINSAVVGLVILFFSLGFFFLYLKYVYKIEVLNPFKPM